MTAAIPQALDELTSKLEMLNAELEQFGLQLSEKISKTLSQAEKGRTFYTHSEEPVNILDPLPYILDRLILSKWLKDDRTIEKYSATDCRHAVLSSYDELQRECRQFLSRLNQSEAIQQAGKLLGLRATILKFNTLEPDSDTSLKNEDWPEKNHPSHCENF